MITRIFAKLRQWLYPAEFRIEAAPLPRDWHAILERLCEQAKAPSIPVESTERLRFVAELATGVWRLRQKMLEPGTDKPKESFRREYRHLESIWDLLSENGVRIQDHAGRPFDPGQSLEVAGRVPVAGLIRERVQETIKPTIYYHDHHIQRGVVIVETPETSTGDGTR